MQVQLKDGKPTFKQEWHEVGGKRNFYRSRWEYRYAQFLQHQKEKGKIKEWYHEPDTFYFEGIKRGTNNYKPDFKVIFLDDHREYVEVKGYMDAKSVTKLKRMKKYHPKENVRVVDKAWFAERKEKLKQIVKDW